jgi:hypothetical protein
MVSLEDDARAVKNLSISPNNGAEFPPFLVKDDGDGGKVI